MKEVCVVGCGGIGSYFAQHIDRLIELKQIKEFDFTFFDDDTVELKNMLYQNFDTCDIDSSKADALEMRCFNVSFKNKRVAYKDLANYNLIILCADNNLIRIDTWKNWENNNIPFIDARANGKTVGIFSSDTQNYLNTLSDSTE